MGSAQISPDPILLRVLHTQSQARIIGLGKHKDWDCWAGATGVGGAVCCMPFSFLDSASLVQTGANRARGPGGEIPDGVREWGGGVRL